LLGLEGGCKGTKHVALISVWLEPKYQFQAQLNSHLQDIEGIDPS
jgi:hypothetical protein